MFCQESLTFSLISFAFAVFCFLLFSSCRVCVCFNCYPLIYDGDYIVLGSHWKSDCGRGGVQ